ncbi:MAG: sulfurtransferase [Candidatus Thioglobus sp. TMED218]|jgi:rhodanese-related sulfurtransferase|nr:sulfurtransferase [Candidatus Thioglobus sp.]MBA4732697.1 rhodanese-like domain-containing protein [Candidatus Thioglobus sp.]OUW81827.1 MAG: sulfurtransferase [Candidatus Thioglobus sp. TMED218]|tara:strand:+ start:133 stop:546 length:414 start_codon:yes stop_codon:yes gene_type:complete
MEFIQFLQGELLLTGTLFALIILLIVNLYSEKYRKYQVVDTNGAVSLMDDDELLIIDVREEKERKAGFLSNDLNIPMGQVKAKMDTLDKSKNILVYCKSGTRSDRIADILSKNDFQKVSSLKGGFNAWLKADLPIQR